jgi:hypothetical protein
MLDRRINIPCKNQICARAPLMMKEEYLHRSGSRFRFIVYASFFDHLIICFLILLRDQKEVSLDRR